MGFTKADSSGSYNFGYMDFWGNHDIFLNSKSEKNKDAGEIFINPTCLPEEKFPVKIWRQYKMDSTYQVITKRYNKDYKLTDTVDLDVVIITGKNPKGYLTSDKEITPKDDSTWMSLHNYVGGKAMCLILPQPCTKNTFYFANYNYFDMDGKKIYNRVPPVKISMKEVDRVAMYRLVGFMPGSGATKITYTIDVYAKYDKFSTAHYPEKKFMRNANGGLYVEVDGNIDYNSLSSVVTGYYEERKFYAPQFDSSIDKQNYFGTYFWQANIHTGINGDTVVYYNPEKQPSGKIRVEGITNAGIPFAGKY